MKIKRISTPVVLAASLMMQLSAASHAETIMLAANDRGIWADPTSSSGQLVALEFLGGYGNLDFSDGDYSLSQELPDIGGAQGFFNVARITFMGTGGASAQQTIVEESYFGDPVTVDTRWSSPSAGALSFQGAGVDAGQISTISLQGGLELSGTRVTGVLSGGRLSLSNVRVDLANKVVVADLVGTNAAGATFSSTNTAVWSFNGSVTGPDRLSYAALASDVPGGGALAAAGFTVVESIATPVYQTSTCYSGGSGGYYGGGYGGGYYYPCPIQTGVSVYTVARGDLQLDNLELTQAAAQIMDAGLGLLTTADNAQYSANYSYGKWGSLKVGYFFRTGEISTSWPALPASIPEPSTYLLMGLGLVAVCLAHRRQTSSQA